MNVRAFSKNDGVPSTSSKASKIGRPITVDLAGSLSFTVEAVQKIRIKGKKKVIDFYSIKHNYHHKTIHNKSTLQRKGAENTGLRRNILLIPPYVQKINQSDTTKLKTFPLSSAILQIDT